MTAKDREVPGSEANKLMQDLSEAERARLQAVAGNFLVVWDLLQRTKVYKGDIVFPFKVLPAGFQLPNDAVTPAVGVAPSEVSRAVTAGRVRVKWIKGNPYLYEETTVWENGRSHTKHLRYLGRVKNI